MILLLSLALAGDRCTYTPTVWNVHAEAARPLPRVDKARESLTAAELGPFGCTPCEQDQRTVTLSNGVPLTACVHVVDRARVALDRALAAGAVIVSVQGYRPGYSRGEPDAAGDRTALSLHAFGVALDVNRDHNGLYTDCVSWGPGCRLTIGGPWRPGDDPASLAPDGPVVAELAAMALFWGGRLEGRQKDFMHFGPSEP